jgi:hypothetical protein
MTSGSRHDMVSSPRLVGGFHDVQTCSGVFLVMRWMMFEKVSGVTALWAQLSSEAKLS